MSGEGYRAFRLGTFQAHALACPPLALWALAKDWAFLAVLFGISAALSWYGWHRDYGLRWTL